MISDLGIPWKSKWAPKTYAIRETMPMSRLIQKWLEYCSTREVSWYPGKAMVNPQTFKPGLHLNANANDACGNEARQNVWYICTLFDFAKAANRPYINVLNVNSLWITNCQWIAFDKLQNVRHTTKCCSPHLGNISTLNDCFVFACCVRICVLFALACKPGFSLAVNFVYVV